MLLDRIYNSAFIADIHIGTKRLTPMETKEMLYNAFIEKLERVIDLDFLFIAGDLYDTLLSAQDEYTLVGVWFVKECVRVCHEKGALCRVISGTPSHDRFIRNIEPQYIPTPDGADRDILKVFRTVSVEEVRGLRILYLPEEFVSKPENYYNDYLRVADGYYDIIVGHGLIDQAKLFHSDDIRYSTRSPLFNSLNLVRVCKGPVLFGHVHHHALYHNKRMGYIGQTFATGFPDKNAKERPVYGWVLSSYDKTTGGVYNGFVENEFSHIYEVLKLNSYIINDSKPENIIEMIDRYKADNDIDYLKVIGQYANNDENYVTIQVVDNYLKRCKNIVFNMKGVDPEQITDGDEGEESEPIKEHLRKDILLSERVQLWIKYYKNREYPIEQIKKYVKD